MYITNYSQTHPITPTLITKVPQETITYLGADLGLLALKVSAHSLQATGTMVLLVVKVDTNIIQILGCWHSNERFLYLPVKPIMKKFASKMLNADFTLLPSQLVPCH